MNLKKLFLVYLACLTPLFTMAQSPTVAPKALYITVNGEEIEDASQTQNAPLKAQYYANPSDIGDYDARYEWIIWKDGNTKDLLVHRFEEDIDYTFSESGTFQVQLYATFICGQDTIVYPDDEGMPQPIVVSISESKLEFPNAFSPNGDGFNDVLKAKSGWQSIVEFEAAVFNRAGRKLFSWNNPDDGWDGKVNGSTVRDGVYFLVVKAKGSDGHNYNIRKTISVLTGYSDESASGGNGDE